MVIRKKILLAITGLVAIAFVALAFQPVVASDAVYEENIARPPYLDLDKLIAGTLELLFDQLFFPITLINIIFEAKPPILGPILGILYLLFSLLFSPLSITINLININLGLMDLFLEALIDALQEIPGYIIRMTLVLPIFLLEKLIKLVARVLWFIKGFIP